jgi:surface polysaccharide O-acyltransferase-like enzyme
MFLNYIHNLRAIAILLIVSGHCLDAFHWSQEPEFSMLAFLYKNGTVLFVFISGFLFQHLSHKFHYSKYLITKLKYVISPYLLVSIPAIAYFTIIVKRSNFPESFYTQSVVWQILEFYFTGRHVTAFWFIPMISIFYVLSPLLVKLDADGRWYCLLPLFVVVSILVPRGETTLVNFVHFFSVYVLGMWFSRNRDRLIPRLARHGWVLLALYGASVLIFIIGGSKIPGPFSGLSYFNKLILCLLLLSLAYRYDELIGNRADFLASISFGIFFTHSYFIQGIRYFLGGSVMGKLPFDGSLLYHLMLFLSVLSLCSIAIVMVRTIAGRYSRNVIGS